MAYRKTDIKRGLLTSNETNSIGKAAARYLNCSYQHLKPFMKAYKDEATGMSLFDMHKNQCGKGIPKFMSNSHLERKYLQLRIL
jgi:hypothetical protein